MRTKRATCAAEYMRMSTDRQDLSLEFQAAAIREYAASKGLQLTASFVDEAKSGLTLHKRPEMRRLLNEVASPDCRFGSILVYDVSRWGRYQDPDAAAYYEYHCRLHGVNVVYVHEPFALDASPMSALMKSLKRTMAAEYIRELAEKTRAGQTAAIVRGFQMGSLPCLGFRRVAVSVDGTTRELGPRDLKGRPTDHIRWVPGPAAEVALVRRIFEEYAGSEISMNGLLRQLSDRGVRNWAGIPITERMLSRLLENEAYIGNFVWGRSNRTSRPNPIRRRPSDPKITRMNGALAPILDKELWDRVQAKKRSRGGWVRTRDELLGELKAALDQKPTLTSLELKTFGCASYAAYRQRFGSYPEALQLAGVDGHAMQKGRSDRHALCRQVGCRILTDICELMTSRGTPCKQIPRMNVIELGAERKVRVRVQMVSRQYWRERRTWRLQRASMQAIAWALIVRLEDDGTANDFLLVDRAKYLEMTKWLPNGVPKGSQSLRSAEELAVQLRRLSQQHLQ